jgi:hypothetical protein
MDKNEPKASYDKAAPIPASIVEVTEILCTALKSKNSKKLRQIVKWVESGGDLDWRSPNGWTLLHLSVLSGNEKMVRFLIKHGADIEATDERGDTPLTLALEDRWIQAWNPLVVKSLLKLGADPTIAIDIVKKWDTNYITYKPQVKIKKILMRCYYNENPSEKPTMLKELENKIYSLEIDIRYLRNSNFKGEFFYTIILYAFLKKVYPLLSVIFRTCDK